MKLVTTKRINECISMLETIKQQSCNITETITNKKHTLIKDVNSDSLHFVINEAIDLLEQL